MAVEYEKLFGRELRERRKASTAGSDPDMDTFRFWLEELMMRGQGHGCQEWSFIWGHFEKSLSPVENANH